MVEESMLAEPRRKKKFSNPNGTLWSKDQSKFGLKLMQKMGWTEGRGLGAKEEGSLEHVKVAHKMDNRGMGCSLHQADVVSAHQDDFDQLLSQLNQASAPGGGGQSEQGTNKKTASLEKKSKSSRKRIHYHKFTKGKDLSGYGSTDLDQILGRSRSGQSSPAIGQSSQSSPAIVQSGQSSPAVGRSATASPVPDGGNPSELKVSVSTLSLQEYFAQKMAARKAGLGSGISPPAEDAKSEESAGAQGGMLCNAEETKTELCDGNDDRQFDSQTLKRKSKKSKKRKKEEDSHQCDTTEEYRNEAECGAAKKKQKKMDEPEEALCGLSKSKKKGLGKTKERLAEEEAVHEPTDGVRGKKDHKKRDANRDCGISEVLNGAASGVDVSPCEDQDLFEATRKRQSKNGKSKPKTNGLGSPSVDCGMETITNGVCEGTQKTVSDKDNRLKSKPDFKEMPSKSNTKGSIKKKKMKADLEEGYPGSNLGAVKGYKLSIDHVKLHLRTKGMKKSK